MKFLTLTIVLIAIIGVKVNAEFAGCEAHGQGYWADPDSCTKFHVCFRLSPASPWTHYPMECWAGKGFNAKYGFCSVKALSEYCGIKE